MQYKFTYALYSYQPNSYMPHQLNILWAFKEFATPNEEWALFVMGNRDRNSEHPTHPFDIVIGPVADDEMATQFRYFKDGIIDLEKLVSKTRFHKVSSQYFFHTDRAIKYLKPYE